jgi:hypothetical protein
MADTNDEGNKTLRKTSSITKNKSTFGCQCGCGTPNKLSYKKLKALVI